MLISTLDIDRKTANQQIAPQFTPANPYLKNKFNESPQDIAKKYQQTHIAQLYDQDAIIKALKNNKIQSLTILIDVFKHDINQVDEDGKTP
ncbi:MAG: hypothetical protein ACKPKO_59675, partial [Candidatus Fonsibacter sp.]